MKMLRDYCLVEILEETKEPMSVVTSRPPQQSQDVVIRILGTGQGLYGSNGVRIPLPVVDGDICLTRRCNIVQHTVNNTVYNVIKADAIIAILEENYNG